MTCISDFILVYIHTAMCHSASLPALEAVSEIIEEQRQSSAVGSITVSSEGHRTQKVSNSLTCFQ